MSKNRGRRKKIKGLVRRSGPPLTTNSNNRAPESSHPAPQQPLTPAPTAHAPPQAGLPVIRIPFILSHDDPLLADLQRASLLRAGPSGADPSQAGPSRVLPLLSNVPGAAIRAGPSRADPAQAGSSQAGSSIAEPSRTDPSEVGPPLAGLAQAGRPLPGPLHAGSSGAGSSGAGSSGAGSSGAGSSQADPPQAGPPQAGPSCARPSQAGPAHAGTLQTGPSLTGSSRTDSLEAGPSRAGPSQLDFLPEIETSKPLDMDTHEYRLPDHTNGSVVNFERETREEHLARDTSPLNSDDVPPPLPAKDTPASPSLTGPSHTDPSEAGPLHASPSRAGPSQASPSQAGPSQAGLSQPGTPLIDSSHDIPSPELLKDAELQEAEVRRVQEGALTVAKLAYDWCMAAPELPVAESPTGLSSPVVEFVRSICVGSFYIAQLCSMFLNWLKSASRNGDVASTFIDYLKTSKTAARSSTGPGVRPSIPSQFDVPEQDLPEPSVPPAPPSGESFENATNESGAPFLTQSGQNPQDLSVPESSTPYSHPSQLEIPEEDLPEPKAEQVSEQPSVPASPPSGDSFETATQEANPSIPTISEQNSQALSVPKSQRSEDGSPERHDPASQEDTGPVKISEAKPDSVPPEPYDVDPSKSESESESSSGISSSSDDDASNPSTNRSSPPLSRGKGKLLKDIFPAMTSPYLVAPDHDPGPRGMTWRVFRKSITVLQASIWTNTIAAFDFRSHPVLHFEEMETLTRALDLFDNANFEARLFPFLRDLFALRPSCVRVPPRRFYHGRTPDRGTEFYASLRWTYWRRLMRRAPSDANRLRARELAQIPVAVLMKVMEAFFEARMNHHKKDRDHLTAGNGTEQQPSVRLLRLSNFQVIPETILDESSQQRGPAARTGDSSGCTESELGEAIDGWLRDMVLADGGETETTNPRWQAFWAKKFGLEDESADSEMMQQRKDHEFEWRISN